MREPAAQAQYRFSVMDEDITAIAQNLPGLRRHARGVEEDRTADFRVIPIKSISANIDGRRMRDDIAPLADFLSILRDLHDLPARLDAQLKYALAIGDDQTRRALKVSLAAADQEHIVHVAQIVTDVRDSLPAPGLIALLQNKVIQRLKIKISEPLGGVSSDRQSLERHRRRAVNDLQHLRILDDPAKLLAQDILIDVFVELANVEFYEILGALIAANPLLDRLASAFRSTAGNAAVGVRVHSAHQAGLDRLNEHPLHKMIGQRGRQNPSLFSSRRTDDHLPQGRSRPAVLHKFDEALRLFANLFRIEPLAIRVAETAANDDIAALVLCSVDDGLCGVFDGAEGVP